MKQKLLLFTFFILTSLIHAQSLFPFLGKTGYGFCTPEGEIVISPQYAEVDFFDKFGFANVRKDSLWFLIDKEGNEYTGLKHKEKIEVKQIHNIQKFEHDKSNTYEIPYTTLSHLLIAKPVDYQNFFDLINQKNKTISTPYLTNGIIDNYITPTYDYADKDTNIPNYFKNILVVLNKQKQFSAFDTLGNLLLQNVSEIKILSHKLLSYQENDKTILYDFEKKQNKILPYCTIQSTKNDSHFIVVDDKHKVDEDNTIDLNTSQNMSIISINGKVLFSDTLNYMEAITPVHYLAHNGKNQFLIKIENGNILIKTFKKINNLENGLLSVNKIHKKAQVIDYEGNIKYKSNYDEIERDRDFEPKPYYTYTIDKRVGLMDFDFKKIFEFEAGWVEKSEIKGFYVFQNNCKYGIVRQDGKVIIPSEYADVHTLDNRFFIVRAINGSQNSGNNCGLFSIEGKMIMQPIYFEIYTEKYKGKDYFFTGLHNKSQLFDENGKRLNESDLKYFHHINEPPISIDQISYSPDTCIIYDRFGKIIEKMYSSCSLEKIIVKSDSSRFYILDYGYWINQGKKVLYDKEGVFLDSSIELSPNFIRDLSYGFFPIKKNGQEAVINHKKEMVIPFDYQFILEINEHYIVLKKKKKFYFYTHKGELINTEGYAEYGHNYFENKIRYVVKLSNINTCKDSTYSHELQKYNVFLANCKEYGFVDTFGKLVIPFQYDTKPLESQQFICTGYGRIDGQKKSYILDKLGKILLETTHDYLGANETLSDTQNYYFYFRNKGKYGLIDLKGKEIIPPNYYTLRSVWENNLFYIKDENGEKFMNVHQKTIANFEDRISEPEVRVGRDLNFVKQIGNIFLLRLKDKTLVINDKGEIKHTINATKVQPYFSNNQYYYRGLDNENLKLLKIEQDKKIWYFNYETFKAYKD